MYMTLSEFMKESNSRIERMLLDKMRLIGYYKDDILSKDPDIKPDMKRYVLEQREDYVHEEYAVNGIRLFNVEWSPGECIITDAAV